MTFVCSDLSSCSMSWFGWLSLSTLCEILDSWDWMSVYLCVKLAVCFDFWLIIFELFKFKDFLEICDRTIWLEYDESSWEFWTTEFWPSLATFTCEAGWRLGSESNESFFVIAGTVICCWIWRFSCSISFYFWLISEFDKSDWLYKMEYFSSKVIEFIDGFTFNGVNGSFVAGVSWYFIVPLVWSFWEAAYFEIVSYSWPVILRLVFSLGSLACSWTLILLSTIWFNEVISLKDSPLSPLISTLL